MKPEQIEALIVACLCAFLAVFAVALWRAFWLVAQFGFGRW